MVEAEGDGKEMAVTRAADVGEDSLEADEEGKESPWLMKVGRKMQMIDTMKQLNLR